jgi:hypothetical protein
MLAIQPPHSVIASAIPSFMHRGRRFDMPAPVRCSVGGCPNLATILDDDEAFCGEHAPDPPNIAAARIRRSTQRKAD